MGAKHSLEFIKLKNKLSLVYSPNKIKNEYFEKFNCTKNLRDLYNLSDIDFGIISSPNAIHYENLKLLLSHNKFAFVDKPFLLSFKDLENLFLEFPDMANKCFVAFNLRYEPSVDFLKSILEDKSLGKLHRIEAKWKRSIVKDENTWYMNKNLSGGGILIDWGVHVIDLIIYITGENFDFINVFNKKSQHGIENELGIELLSKTGINLVVDLSWLAKSKEDENPLEIEFIFKNNRFKWKKSGQIRNSNSGKIKNFQAGTNLMYKYFLKNYLINNQNESLRIHNFKIYSDVIKIIDDIYSGKTFQN